MPFESFEMMVFRECPLGQELMKEVAQRMLLRLLHHRFGKVPESVKATLQGLSLEELEYLVEELVQVNSLDELNVKICQKNATHVISRF